MKMTPDDARHHRRRRRQPTGLEAVQVATPLREFTPDHGPGFLNRTFPLTDMPTWVMLALAALGLPRTVLEDLGIVEPGSSLLYYVLALTPFAVWLAVAVTRQSSRPFMNFLVLGVLYGLSLVFIHQMLWSVGSSLGHQPPVGAVNFAEQFSPAWHELALRGYTVLIALLIGVGSGLVAALVAVMARMWRDHRPTSQ